MLDALDVQILEHLQVDGRASHRTIAKALGSTQPTVTARIKRMEGAGIIKGYTVRLDEGAFQGAVHEGAQIACHWCKRRTGDPVWARVAGIRHPFCCPTCKGSFIARDAELRQGL